MTIFGMPAVVVAGVALLVVILGVGAATCMVLMMRGR
jgi:hypothetical protein